MFDTTRLRQMHRTATIKRLEAIALGSTALAFALTVMLAGSAYAVESNPIARGLLDSVGWLGAGVLALVAEVLIFEGYRRLEASAPRAALAGAALVASIGVADVLVNVWVFSRVGAPPSLSGRLLGAIALVMLTTVAIAKRELLVEAAQYQIRESGWELRTGAVIILIVSLSIAGVAPFIGGALSPVDIVRAGDDTEKWQSDGQRAPIAQTSNGSYIVATNDGGSGNRHPVLIYAKNGTVAKEYPDQGDVKDVAISPDDQVAYTYSTSAKEMSVIDISAQSVSNFSVPRGNTEAIAAGPKVGGNRTLYYGVSSNDLGDTIRWYNEHGSLRAKNTELSKNVKRGVYSPSKNATYWQGAGSNAGLQRIKADLTESYRVTNYGQDTGTDRGIEYYDGTVYMITQEGKFIAADESDGSKIFKRSVPTTSTELNAIGVYGESDLAFLSNNEAQTVVYDLNGDKKRNLSVSDAGATSASAFDGGDSVSIILGNTQSVKRVDTGYVLKSSATSSTYSQTYVLDDRAGRFWDNSSSLFVFKYVGSDDVADATSGPYDNTEEWDYVDTYGFNSYNKTFADLEDGEDYALVVATGDAETLQPGQNVYEQVGYHAVDDGTTSTIVIGSEETTCDGDVELQQTADGDYEVVYCGPQVDNLSYTLDGPDGTVFEGSLDFEDPTGYYEGEISSNVTNTSDTDDVGLGNYSGTYSENGTVFNQSDFTTSFTGGPVGGGGSGGSSTATTFGGWALLAAGGYLAYRRYGNGQIGKTVSGLVGR